LRPHGRFGPLKDQKEAHFVADRQSQLAICRQSQPLCTCIRNRR
jgi:hypothetical protein